jgi:hypothetical protein
MRGQSHLSLHLETLQHPAHELLMMLWTHGMPVVTSGPGWTHREVTDRLNHGSHKSTHKHVDFVCNEMADFARKGFWTVLPYDLVKHLHGLHLSPLGCIPQCDRWPCLIVDLSFYGINADTLLKLSLPKTMQFSQAPDHLLYRIRHANPSYCLVYMNKIDISDGFYPVALAADSAPKVAIVLPTQPGKPTLIAIPLSLPMGWVESPPTFCAVTKTVADLANWQLPCWHALPRQLEQFVNTPPPIEEALVSLTIASTSGPCAPLALCPSIKDPLDIATRPSPPAVPHMLLPCPAVGVPSCQPHALPLAYTDVYVDDFCNLVQGSPRHCRIAHRILFHAIYEIICPLDPTHPFHQEPISIKKTPDWLAY